jgi:hypothetical protein
MGLRVAEELPFIVLSPSVFAFLRHIIREQANVILMISDIEQYYEKSINHLYYYKKIITTILHRDLLSFLVAWAFAFLICAFNFSPFLCACAVLIMFCVPVWKLGKCSLFHLRSAKPKFKSGTPDALRFARNLARMLCDWICASFVVLLLRYRENTPYLHRSKCPVIHCWYIMGLFVARYYNTYVFSQYISSWSN